VLVTPLGYGL